MAKKAKVKTAAEKLPRQVTFEYKSRKIVFDTMTRRFHSGNLRSFSIDKIEKAIDKENRLVEVSIPVLFERVIPGLNSPKYEIINGVVIGIAEANRNRRRRYTMARVRFRVGTSDKFIIEDMFWSCLYVCDSENLELLNEQVKLEAEMESLSEKTEEIRSKLRNIEEP